MRRALLCLCLVVGCSTAKPKEDQKAEKSDKAAEKGQGAAADKAANRMTCQSGTPVAYEGGEACVDKPLANVIKCLELGFGAKPVRGASDAFLGHRGVKVGDTQVGTGGTQADFVAAYIRHTKPDLDACVIINHCARAEGVDPICP